MNYPLVSVVMATYNDLPKYLSLAISSILNQTFRNFELIILDDSTNINTIDTINLYSNDDRVIIIRKQKKMGFVSALNEGIKIAKGKYIARMDGDDISLPNRLKMQVDFMEKHSDFVLISSSMSYIDENNNIIGRNFSYLTDGRIKKILQITNPIVHTSALFKKDVCLRIGGYSLINNSEDYLLWKQMSKYGKIKLLLKPIVQYRKLSNSLSSQYNLDRFNYFILMRLLCKMANDEFVKEEDITLFNILDKNLKNQKEMANESKKIGQTRDEKLFIFLKHIFNESIADILLSIWVSYILFDIRFYKLKHQLNMALYILL
jgi:glycosyltransferase EpsE